MGLNNIFIELFHFNINFPHSQFTLGKRKSFQLIHCFNLNFYWFFPLVFIFLVSNCFVNLNSEPVHAGTNSDVVGKVLNGSDSSNGWATIVDVFHGDIADVLSGDVLWKESKLKIEVSVNVFELTSMRFSSSWRGILRL